MVDLLEEGRPELVEAVRVGVEELAATRRQPVVDHDVHPVPVLPELHNPRLPSFPPSHLAQGGRDLEVEDAAVVLRKGLVGGHDAVEHLISEREVRGCREQPAVPQFALDIPTRSPSIERRIIRG